ncbi:shikimate dehydrogenase [Pyrobaculum islandicum DSM 4184]|uniref:Shikimate dehydrogenase (NADP(+)) n=1 Tax=Pyrobaculum islandicum (strain DSM 4184 / JCM 9189 / GEO3) TaxID=384616 RepID=AROE_PYRIL|nr:shikimate dehydrogenase [Pyrobaculum islandicum]A1RVD2.1 RecName: Full=Shikimate dehydrogenase (NADP(+)); Short=SDH [Pyrobaculum islandicum DSM 4184]ABL88914.1 shikimate dehydrogenase [Pyrobaculum islandicum DSM 4184]
MYFAVIGTHVRGKSASPAMHNASFKTLGINAVYIALDVPREELPCFLQLARLNLRGFNVTIPHKEEVVKYLDSVAADARAIGAVNTVLVERNLLVGYNTDASALYQLASSHMKGADVLIVGAGGAARAALFAAIKAEARAVYITNRTYERAEALAREFAEKFKREVKAVRGPVKADVVINATPVYDAVVADLSGASLYVDFAYIPTPRTKMVEEAQRLGIKVIDGVDLLVEQGAQAEKIWLGVEPDRTVMKRAVLEFLGI